MVLSPSEAENGRVWIIKTGHSNSFWFLQKRPKKINKIVLDNIVSKNVHLLSMSVNIIPSDKVEASFEKGVLKITLPEAEDARKKDIGIKVK